MLFIWKFLVIAIGVIVGIIAVIMYARLGLRDDEEALKVWNGFSVVDRSFFENDIENYKVISTILTTKTFYDSNNLLIAMFVTIKAILVLIIGTIICFYEGKIPDNFRLMKLGSLPFAANPILIEKPITDKLIEMSQGKSYYHVGIGADKIKEY